MGSFSDKWHALKNNEKLSQAFMGRVKPDAPLKNRLDIAQKKLQSQQNLSLNLLLMSNKKNLAGKLDLDHYY